MFEFFFMPEASRAIRYTKDELVEAPSKGRTHQ